MKKTTTRRNFVINSAKVSAGFALTSCANLVSRSISSTEPPDFIIVGSGAGGGPLAARLALRGYHVLLLEAGRDHTDPDNPELQDPKLRVPAYQGISTEDSRWSWDFFVRHSSGRSSGESANGFEFNDTLDTKFIPSRNGILYPRASALGGCTIHNAMITMIADPQDWENIKNITGDKSWNKMAMGQLFIDRVQNKRYGGGLYSSMKDEKSYFQSPNGSWLSAERASPELVAKDRNLRQLITKSAMTSLLSGSKLINDPNSHPFSERQEGATFTPQATHQGRRTSPRDWLLEVQKKTGRLEIMTGYFVTNLLFDERNPSKVVGVEGLYREDKKNLYEAAKEYQSSNLNGAIEFGFRAKKEVILAGGSFNTPQLLMLSGVGPQDELERHRIPVRVNLPGVGKNLQDRYEFSVVARFKNPSTAIQDCTFNPEKGDPCFEEYNKTKNKSEHLYSSNGVIIGHVHKSDSARNSGGEADLFVFAAPGNFPGYSPNWSQKAVETPDYLTWAILKAKTRNTKGYVKLKNNSAHSTPEINFMNFAEGKEEDLGAVMEGVKIARSLNKKMGALIAEEVWPPQKNPQTGRELSSSELKDFVMKEIWGHHASCTCKMGPASDEMAVVNSKFEVHKLEGLRIVDASVFPKIPGLFIAGPIYTIAEKAADVITQKYSR